ncbi:MAG: hypothetical protein JSR76_08620 [Verrucomicrobia bacterium]|nr:hypothetical protein [Verrucomicrobiota bacterium]
MVIGIHRESFPQWEARDTPAPDAMFSRKRSDIDTLIANLSRRRSLPQDTRAACDPLMERDPVKSPPDFRVLTEAEKPWWRGLVAPFFSKGDTGSQDLCCRSGTPITALSPRAGLLVNEADLLSALRVSEERDRAETALAESVRQATLTGWKPESIDIFHAALKLLARHKMPPAFETLLEVFLPGDASADARRGVRSYIAHSLYVEKDFTTFDTIVRQLANETSDSVEALFTNLLHTILPQGVAPFIDLLARFKKACPDTWEEQTRQFIAMADDLPPGFLP